MEEIRQYALKIIEETSKVIHGKNETITKVLAAWMSGGHVLLEDVPGTGKTLLSKTLAKVMGVDFKRIQFTPDLLPGDITGGLVLAPDKNQFIFREGPLFCSLFLGDEINRASPRTQSALLEAMGEGQVSIDGKTRSLDRFFFVMATQNPIDQHGTFPLPEAQLDRFLIKLSLGYPPVESEFKMVKSRLNEDPFLRVQSLGGELDKLEKLRRIREKVQVGDDVLEYALKLVEKSRNHPGLQQGASPRSLMALVYFSQSWAFLQGQSFLTPQNIFELFPLVMSHRLQLTPEAKFSGTSKNQILKDILSSVKVPIAKR